MTDHGKTSQAGALAASPATGAGAGATAQCPYCHHVFASGSGKDGALLSRVRCPQCATLVLISGRLGDFVLVDRIASDNTGNVYRATGGGQELPPEVAIKVLPSLAGTGKVLLDQVQAALGQAMQVNNPHVPRILAQRRADNIPFLVMELIAGESLENRTFTALRMPEHEVLRMAIDVTDGLAALHGAGLIHGNVKPASILLCADGSARLTNPGLCGVLCRDAMGGVLGSPMYIAPELIRGEPHTPQSDIYSLGVTLYTLLANQPPFAGTTPEEIFRNHQFAVVYPVGVHAPALSRLTKELVGRMMRRLASERYPDCAALSTDLRMALAALDKLPSKPQALPHPARQPRPPQTSYRQLLVLAGAICGSLALATLLLLSWEAGMFEAQPAQHPVILPRRLIYKSIPVSVRSRQCFDAACNAAVSTCTRRIRPEWQQMTVGAEASHGMTLWRGESVTLIGGGTGINGLADNCRFLYTSVKAPCIASLCVLHSPNTHPRAQIGLLARETLSASSPCVFAGFTGNGNLLLLCRSRAGGELETVRTVLADMNEWRPCYLKLESSNGRFRASASRDSATWEVIGTCRADISETCLIGVAVASLTTNVMATAECADLRVMVPPPTAAAPSAP